MKEDIEYHTDKSPWIACNEKHTFPTDKVVDIDGVKVRVYHPDYKCIGYCDRYGEDTEYECNCCKKTWWVERDG